MEVAGPGLGGLIAQAFGAVCGLVANAASFAVSLVCLLTLRTDEPPHTPTRRQLRAEIATGMRFVVGDPYLRVLMAFGAVANLALSGYGAIQVVFLVRVVGLGSGTVGLLLALISLGGVFGATVSGRIAKWVGTARAVILCELVGTPCGLLIPLTSKGFGLTYVLVGGLLLDAGLVASNVIQRSFRQSYVPDRIRGRVSTSGAFLNYGAVPLGAVLAGSLGTALGIRPTLWIMTGVLALSGLILLLGPARHRRDYPSAPVGSQALVELAG